MSDTKVLLLGWDLMPVGNKEVDQANGCFAIAKALGGRVDLSMVLPAADPDFILQNVTLTGLNNVDLPSIEPAAPKKEIQPFAQEPYIRQQIPLYGAPVHPVSAPALAQAAQVGEAASAGMLQKDWGVKDHLAVTENGNLFDPGHLGQVALEAQIIQYARWATRLAAHRQFQVVYAYDWRTFLAGSELKLVCEKPLVLQVHSLNEVGVDPNTQGWMHQIEIQALQKADRVIAATDELAAIIAEKYFVSPALIHSLEEKDGGSAIKPAALSEEDAADLNKGALVKDMKNSPKQILAKKAEQEQTWARAADRIRDILLQVVA